MENDLEKQHSCSSCMLPDNHDNMVACDNCNLWFHYGCAKVDASVEKNDWSCPSCRTLTPLKVPAITKPIMRLKVPNVGDKKSTKSVGGSKTGSKRSKKSGTDQVSMSSSTRERLQLQLKELDKQKCIEEEELKLEKEMQERHLAEEKKLRNQVLAIQALKLADEKLFLERKIIAEKAFRKQQMAIRQKSLEDKARIERQLSQCGSSKGSSRHSEVDSESRVKGWLESLLHQKPVKSGSSVDVNSGTSTSSIRSQPPSAEHEPRLLPDFEDLTLLQNKSQGAVRKHTTVNDTNTYNGPTSRLIAARQVLGKDLPIFSGDPEDWPIWISNFERSTATCGFSSDENLMRLQRCLKGHALEAVRSRLLSPASVPHVIKTLQMRYGRPETLIRSMTEKIRQIAPPQMHDLDCVIEFGLAVDNLVEHLKTAKQHAHLANPSLLHDLVGKLPVEYRLKWSAYKSTTADPTLSTFGKFMSSLVELACEVADDNPTGYYNKNRKQKQKEKMYLQAHTEYPPNYSEEPSINNHVVSEAPKRKCIVCKQEGHRVADCLSFSSMDIDERLKTVKINNLCLNCLNSHGNWPCKTWKGCGIEGCRLRHHTLLHPANLTVAVSTSHLIRLNRKNAPLFRIIPVTLYGSNCSIDVFAFLDEGSQLTLMEDAVAEQLGIAGPVEPLTLQWTGNVKRLESNSRRATAQISRSMMKKRFNLLGARTVSSLLLPSQSLCYQELSEMYPHLRGLPLNNFDQIEPKLLIGLDNLKLTVPLKIREGGWNDPIAAKCRLGWSIYGHSPEGPQDTVCGFHVEGRTDYDGELNELVRDYFTLDSVGVSPSVILESDDDKRAKLLLESTSQRISTGFETGLLWRSDKVSFPNSYGMAYRRLCSLEKRLSGDPKLYDSVRQQISEYQDKGYAHQASQYELNTTQPNKTWYLPLGVVVNPKKLGKVRLIWDAAAQVDGVSFNSALLKGPDLLTLLPAVLSRFRLYQFALTGDIKEMFHRIRIREEDRQFQRFIWRESADQQAQVFVMDVATFGATCSPSSAQYIKNRNAEEFSEKYPQAAAAIVYHHYVDDYLDSFGTIQEAIKVGKLLKLIHAKGNFEIRNFMSNEAVIVNEIGGRSEKENKMLSLDRGSGVESVLGMKWIPHSDEFTFVFTAYEGLKRILGDSYVPTKREVLKVVMSLFDPLGLIAFFLVHGRILMQDIWAAGTDWDERINTELCDRWWKWAKLLPYLNHIRIPRCYFSNANAETYSSLQIHMFVDASESAYSCVAYFRVDTPKGPSITLVAAKSKVAPLKTISIPRLELQAAVLGTRLMNNISSTHPVAVKKRFLWTDSRASLAWICSVDHRRYHPYVKVRIGEIHSSTNSSEWRWIPSKLNVADDATKWANGPNINGNSRWFNGPDFLLLPEEKWPQYTEKHTTDEDLIETCSVHYSSVPGLFDVSRFSRWERLHRAQAYVHRFIDNIRKKQAGGQLVQGEFTQSELVKAERSLWSQAQRDVFGEEYEILIRTQGVPRNHHAIVSKSSTIYNLWPYVDEYGVIRKRGRIDAAPVISENTKFPVILPRQHLITHLLTNWFHRRFRHANHETIVNEMRQQFEISALRTLVRTISENCQFCKIRKTIPRAPPMALLPKVRLTPFVRPFTFVGLDYFGPILVKVKRSNVKRWVALFTCLTIRAVHMEVVHNMSTESCVMAVRRFIARRGSPAEIISDNGTNFQGASKQLREEIVARNKTLSSIFTNATTRWIFNPPAAPHMGGVWERMVRSVKTAIFTIMQSNRRPDDEVFETVILEAEAMVNTRPLTYLPLDSAEQEALTPNHFLLLSSNGVKQLPVMPIDVRTTLRSSWKLAQHLTDEIWKRWVREYLPVLSRRSKWFEEVKELAVGDFVLIVDGTVRNQWVRGRIEKVVAGADGRIRQAWVRSSNGLLVRRPAVKLALLDVMDDSKPDQLTGNAKEDYQWLKSVGLRAGECDREHP